MENEVQSIEISKDINIGEVVITLINESIQMINQSLNITFMYEGDISVLLSNLNECNSIVCGEDVYNDYNVIKEFGFKYDNEERQIFKVVLNQPEKEYELPNDVLTAIDYAIQNMDDDQALNCMSIFPLWKEGVTYSEGNRVQYKDKLYKVLQDHTSQSDWTPDTASSLFVEISDPNIEYPEFVQPTGSHDAYSKGSKITFEGKKYVSLIDSNVWSPVSYPSGWEEVF